MIDIAAILDLSRRGKSPVEIAALCLTSWQRVQDILASHQLPRAVARRRRPASGPHRSNGVSSLTSAGSVPQNAAPVLFARGRNPTDFGAACVAHWPALRRYALYLARNSDRAEDLVQDTLVRALSKRHLFQDGTDLSAWLIHMLHNVHVSGLRAQARRGAVLDVTALASSDLRDVAVPALQLRLIEARDGLAKFARLKRHHRDAIGLAVDGVPYERIAVILGISFGTVKSRLCRGRARLRALTDGSICGGRAA